jgi:hypothetical protein
MKNVLKVFCITALVAVTGLSCASSRFVTLEEPIKPDGKSAVVIFFGRSFSKADVWDGEKPVGTFEGTPISTINCIFWKTTPGAHTLVAKSSNFVNKKINLQANRTYYFHVYDIPSPPYTILIVMQELTKKEYDEVIDKWFKLKNKLTLMEYDEEWRKAFLAADKGKKLNEIREYLKTAK